MIPATSTTASCSGSMSEAELHLLKARLRGGALSKARRGELKQSLPVGFVHDGADKTVKDPDASVRGAVEQLFAAFEQTGSALGAVKAFRDRDLFFPRKILAGPNRGQVVWGPLEHSQVLRVLHNPCYAGAYFYGRRYNGRGPNGRPVVKALPREEWTVLITDAHQGYITWARFEANQARLAGNARARGADRSQSPPREGPALLQGLAVCGICGGRMTVRYHTRRGRTAPDYVCQMKGIRTGTPICQAIPGQSIDDAIGALLIEEVTPLALESALAVSDELAARAEQADRLRAQTVQGAQCRADAARRRYLAVDPANRLVADSLEADWNTALREVAESVDAYERATAADTLLRQADRDRITALVTDFPALWNDPATPDRERKRMVRLLIEDVTLRKGTGIRADVRLRGGTARHLDLPLAQSAWQERQTDPAVITAIDELLNDYTDAQTAHLLNEQGLISGTGGPFHAGIVVHLRNKYHLPSRRQRLRQAGLLTPNELGEHLGIHFQTVKRWRKFGILDAVLATDKHEYLYPLPGPDLARPVIGRPTIPRTRPDTETPDESRQGGAV